MMFDSNTKETRQKLTEQPLAQKIMGLQELFVVLGQCVNFADQLQLIATKCQPMLKVMLAGIDAKQVTNDPQFDEFFTQIRFLLS